MHRITEFLDGLYLSWTTISQIQVEAFTYLKRATHTLPYVWCNYSSNKIADVLGTVPSSISSLYTFTQDSNMMQEVLLSPFHSRQRRDIQHSRAALKGWSRNLNPNSPASEFTLLTTNSPDSRFKWQYPASLKLNLKKLQRSWIPKFFLGKKEQKIYHSLS